MLYGSVFPQVVYICAFRNYHLREEGEGGRERLKNGEVAKTRGRRCLHLISGYWR